MKTVLSYNKNRINIDIKAYRLNKLVSTDLHNYTKFIGRLFSNFIKLNENILLVK